MNFFGNPVFDTLVFTLAAFGATFITCFLFRLFFISPATIDAGNRRAIAALEGRLEPRLEVKFAPDSDLGCVKVSREPSPPHEQNCYVRVEVKAPSNISNCCGWLLGVKKLEKGGWVNTDLEEGSLLLKWANLGANAIPIPAGGRQYLQLFRIHESDGLAELTTFFIPVLARNIFVSGGIYRIDVAVSCDNSEISVNKSIEFQYGKSWDKPIVRDLPTQQ